MVWKGALGQDVFCYWLKKQWTFEVLVFWRNCISIQALWART